MLVKLADNFYYASQIGWQIQFKLRSTANFVERHAPPQEMKRYILKFKLKYNPKGLQSRYM